MTAQVALVPLSGFPDAPPHAAMAVPPSRNSTLPVGVPDPGAVTATVAVTYTAWPTTEGEPVVETTEVVVEAALTVWVSADEVEVL